MKNELAATAPRLMLKKQRIVSLTTKSTGQRNIGDSSKICDWLTIQ
ncbi:hypothetical protein [Spirosoma fluviale]|uniref:Uncharacterized protein n=1 Tax=Spirosoma fluviale TaxID=1597977 RepID=A0A286F588_9BACT|nr:hypothetical protein [Spirosoma fluviale]SOD78266.1 hypothetical protein SAMN06269250_0376 [Spirosoma fluviale]